MRRLIATAMLFFTALSGMESVAGMLRDEVMHLENAETVAAHTAEADETGSAGQSGHDHDSEQHRHGSAGDHCSHVHGVAIITSTEFPQFTGVSGREHDDPVFHNQLVTPTLTHPPRA